MSNTSIFPQEDAPVAYIRMVARDALPKDVQEKTKGMDQIYSIHDSGGQVLALVNDRERAFVVARMNEMRPVSVH